MLGLCFVDEKRENERDMEFSGMNTQDYIIKKYEDVIAEYIAQKDFDNVVDVIDRLAEFYLSCTCPCEKQEWE